MRRIENIWIAISILGGLLALGGLSLAVLRYNRGNISGRELVVTLTGFAELVGIIAVGEFVWRDPLTLLLTIFLPLWFAAIYLARGRRACNA